MGFPYPLTFTVTIGGSAVSNARVTLQKAGVSGTIYADTDSNGVVVLDADLLSVVDNDVLHYYVPYAGYFGEGDHTVLYNQGASYYDISVVLTVVDTKGSLRYFSVKDYYDALGWSSADENKPEVAQVLIHGLAAEAWIDSVCATKFDTVTAVSNEYHDQRGAYQCDYYLEKKPLVRLIDFEIDTTSEGSEHNWENLAYEQVDACDATTGWTAGTDGEIDLNSTPDEENEGDACINLRKTGATTDTVAYYKTFSSTYDFKYRDISVDYYIATRTNLTTTACVEIRFGSDSSNYYYKRYNLADISSGWQGLGFCKGNATGVTGDPDATACDYFALVIKTTASSTTFTDNEQRIDNIRLGDEGDLSIDYSISHVRIGNTSLYPSRGVGKVRASYTYGYSTVPYEIKLASIYATAQRLAGVVRLRSAGSGKNIGDAFNIVSSAYKDYIDGLLVGYRGRYISRT